MPGGKNGTDRFPAGLECGDITWNEMRQPESLLMGPVPTSYSQKTQHVWPRRPQLGHVPGVHMETSYKSSPRSLASWLHKFSDFLLGTK